MVPNVLFSDIVRGGYFIPLRCYHTSISLSPLYSQHCRQIKLSFQGLSWFFLAPLKDTGVSVFSEISSAAVAIIAFIYSVSRERAFLLEAREAARARRIASARVVTAADWYCNLREENKNNRRRSYNKTNICSYSIKMNCFNTLLNGITSKQP